MTYWFDYKATTGSKQLLSTKKAAEHHTQTVELSFGQSIQVQLGKPQSTPTAVILLFTNNVFW